MAFWDSLFQQAAAEGISVFVSSGDAGASGCDRAFATPPSTGCQQPELHLLFELRNLRWGNPIQRHSQPLPILGRQQRP